jgi:hypothetical protein
MTEGFRGQPIPLFIAGDPGGGHTQIDSSGIKVYRSDGSLMFSVTPTGGIEAFDPSGNAVFDVGVTAGGLATGEAPNERIALNDPDFGPGSIVYVPGGAITSLPRAEILFGPPSASDLILQSIDGSNVTQEVRIAESTKSVTITTAGATKLFGNGRLDPVEG